MTRKHLMPAPGSDAHRVFVELARHDGAVEEHVLMTQHGLDGRPAAEWRSGPYKSLAADALIVRIRDGLWQLTKLGRAVMDEVEAEMVGTDNGALVPIQSDEPPVIVVPVMAASRQPPPFRPLSRAPLQRPIREGANDYRDIPSLHNGRHLDKETT